MSSAGPVFLRADEIVHAQGLPPEAVDDITRVLLENRIGTVALLFDIALAAGLSREVAIERCAALFFYIGALQVADDLADHECDYLELPEGSGTVSQIVLQNLFFLTLARSGVPNEVLIEAAEHLVRGAGPQHFEIRTQQWTLEKTRAVARGMGAEHFIAYLKLLLSGTPHVERAEWLGHRIGLLVHYYSDTLHRDDRLWTLPLAHRAAVLNEALEAAVELKAESWLPVLTLVRTVEPPLRAALDR